MTTSSDDLRDLAQAHLWGHFSRLAPSPELIPIMERGEGCYVWDTEGKRYLDGLSGLFTVQVGHGRTELAEVAAAQGAQLGYFPIWNYSHPPAIELAAKLASLAPGDLNRVFFTTGGSEAVESAWKLARKFFKMKGKPAKTKAVTRHLGYHGTTMGSLSLTGLPSFRQDYEPLVPGVTRVANTKHYRCDDCSMSSTGCTLRCADDIETHILREGPDTVAAVFIEPVQNSGGCFTAPLDYYQRVREMCDTYDVLLISDETICAYGRLGAMFGSERLGYVPDIITSAKGLTSGYSPLGAVIVSDRIAEPFLAPGAMFDHGITFAGHPVSCAVALANLELFEREGIIEHVRANEAAFRAALETLTDLPIVGDIRGMGYFYGIEMVKDRVTKESFSAEECEILIRQHLSKRMLELGLICRSDDRGDPVIQLAPPLIAGPAEFDAIVAILRQVLLEGMELLGMAVIPS